MHAHEQQHQLDRCEARSESCDKLVSSSPVASRQLSSELLVTDLIAPIPALIVHTRAPERHTLHTTHYTHYTHYTHCTQLWRFGARFAWRQHAERSSSLNLYFIPSERERKRRCKATNRRNVLIKYLNCSPRDKRAREIKYTSDREYNSRKLRCHSLGHLSVAKLMT